MAITDAEKHMTAPTVAISCIASPHASLFPCLAFHIVATQTTSNTIAPTEAMSVEMTAAQVPSSDTTEAPALLIAVFKSDAASLLMIILEIKFIIFPPCQNKIKSAYSTLRKNRH